MTNITYNLNGSITVMCPVSYAAGAMDVTVVSAGGTSATSPADQFAYGLVPTISAIVSNFGPAWLGNSAITFIEGENLSGVTEVDFGSNQYAVTPANPQPTSIAVMVPYHPPGTVVVTVVESPSGLSSSSIPTPANQYTFTSGPIVTGLSVSGDLDGYVYGPASGGTTVTISGYNFMQNIGTGATVVDFGGVPATSFTNNYAGSSSTITAVTPQGSPGYASVTVTTEYGTSSTEYNYDVFTYFGAPSVTGITAAAGPLAGGNWVAISGSGLIDGTVNGWNVGLLDTMVDFGSVAATDCYGISGSLYVEVPAGLSLGPVDVTVTNVGGSVTRSSAYTYMPPPVVTGLSAPSGAAASGAVEGGTPVVITGTLLAGATEVDFGAQAATIVSDTDDQIAVVSPASATGLGPVDVTVTTPDGTSAISEPADLFTYTDAPFISQVTGPLTINGTQAAGLTAGFNTVTISGDDLTGATAVNFGDTVVPQVTIGPKGNQTTNFTISPDGTSITVTDPAGTAGMLDITVTTPLGTWNVSTADQFTYLPMPIVTAISPSLGTSSGGTQVTITGRPAARRTPRRPTSSRTWQCRAYRASVRRRASWAAARRLRSSARAWPTPRRSTSETNWPPSSAIIRMARSWSTPRNGPPACFRMT